MGGDSFLARAFGIVRKESRIYTGQGDEVAQEFGDGGKLSHETKGS